MSDELGMRTEADAAAYAKSKERIIVRPKSNELFVDLDRKEQWVTFVNTIKKFPEWRWVAPPSPSGLPDRRHVIVTLPNAVDERTRIFYQALLGSDPMRELLSWRRLERGEEYPTLFFEKV